MNAVMARKFVWRLLFDQLPQGYVPAVTLGRALAELKGIFLVTMTGTTTALLGSTGDELVCEIRERVERHFLMHLVGVELIQKVPAPSVLGARFMIRNTGMLFRTGIACTVPVQHRSALCELTERLERDDRLKAALMGFDFRRCEITGTAEGWTVLLEPFRASEVVNRMPSFRRYIRLGREQVNALAESMKALQRLLGLPPEQHEKRGFYNEYRFPLYSRR
jgi:hypothetical protein